MNKVLIGLDVGEKRIGVAVADTSVRIAVPFETVLVDDDVVTKITELLAKEQAAVLVIGYPRNQSGEPTQQTTFVERFAKQFEHLDMQLVFQDESLTSVVAEERLKEQGGTYEKGDIDAQAAAIILQDFLEERYG